MYPAKNNCDMENLFRGHTYLILAHADLHSLELYNFIICSLIEVKSGFKANYFLTLKSIADNKLSA